jgi:FxsC-like protein
MAGRASSDSEDRPYFFLSYARAKYHPPGRSARDPHVTEFFNQLCGHISEFAGTAFPGFMDTEIPNGNVWSEDLARALGSCRVFVAVLNGAYCTSAWCGKEWAGFIGRLSRLPASDGSVPSEIVPVLWLPPRSSDLAPAVLRHQQGSNAFPPEYQAEGLYALKVHPRWREAYRRSVFLLAAQIYEAGRASRVPLSGPIDWDSVPNAFEQHLARETMYQIRVRVAAYPANAAQANPARSSDNYYYGRTMLEWMPYRDKTDTTQIAARAQTVISDMRYRAVLDPLDAPVVPKPEPSPSVLLVDPWAPGEPAVGSLLSQIDHHEPAHVVIPWNEDDRETESNGAMLRSNLAKTLPQSLAIPGSAKFVQRLTFVDDFRDVVNDAVALYRKTATVYPPSQAASMSKPILRPDIHETGGADG